MRKPRKPCSSFFKTLKDITTTYGDTQLPSYWHLCSVSVGQASTLQKCKLYTMLRTNSLQSSNKERLPPWTSFHSWRLCQNSWLHGRHGLGRFVRSKGRSILGFWMRLGRKWWRAKVRVASWSRCWRIRRNRDWMTNILRISVVFWSESFSWPKFNFWQW